MINETARLVIIVALVVVVMAAITLAIATRIDAIPVALQGANAYIPEWAQSFSVP